MDQATLQNSPQSADPLAAPMDYSKQWYYVRLADKLSYERDGHQFDASVYWWHRELQEKGFMIRWTRNKAFRFIMRTMRALT